MDLRQKRNLIMRLGTISRIGPVPKACFLLLLFGMVVVLQLEYDATRFTLRASLPGTFTPSIVRMIDMGFHPIVASFLWAGTMPEILNLFSHGNTQYLADLAFLNTVDPKLGYPYAFSVLTLPIVPSSTYAAALGDSFAIGEKGLANADPDWRIPYYMAINYYLALRDFGHATQYFNLAAEMPGVPDYAARFALNFGINQKERDRVRGIWETVYKSTNDPDMKERAAAYVERLNDFDYLEAAAKAYKTRYGSYPSSLDEFVAKGIIPAVPQDPFGFTFVINPDGTAGIDKTKLPTYLRNLPIQ